MMEVPTGKHVRRWRKSLELTQFQLSELSGVAQSIIAEVETEAVDPRSSTLRKIVTALSRFESPEKLHTVGDIMVTNVNALQLQDSVQTAIDRMVQGDISQLPVISEQGNILGIVSESSVLQKGAHRTGLVEQVMDRNPPVIDVSLSVSEARRRLVEVEVLLVTEQDLLVGLVSRMDLVNALRLRSIG